MSVVNWKDEAHAYHEQMIAERQEETRRLIQSGREMVHRELQPITDPQKLVEAIWRLADHKSGWPSVDAGMAYELGLQKRRVTLLKATPQDIEFRKYRVLSFKRVEAPSRRVKGERQMFWCAVYRNRYGKPFHFYGETMREAWMGFVARVHPLEMSAAEFAYRGPK